MKYVTAALVLVTLTACGRDEPHLPPPKASTTVALNTIPNSPTTLVPSDASTPAAGTCANAPDGAVAQITLDPDVPSPRCVIVHSLNQLEFINATASGVTIDTGYDEATLLAHESHLFPQRVGDFWEPGVHRIDTGELYGGSGPEVWLQG